MDDLGPGDEGTHRARQSVIKTAAQGDDQIGLLKRFVGIGLAVHTAHAQTERMGFGQSADAQQGGDHRNLGFLCQLPQLSLGSGQDHPVASQDQRGFGPVDEVGSLFDLAGVAHQDRLIAR